MKIADTYNDMVMETAKIFSSLPYRGDCMDRGLLIAYLQGNLDGPLRKEFDDHITTCELCHLTKLMVEADQTEFDLSLIRNPDATLGRMIRPDGAKRLASLFHQKGKERVREGVTKIKEALVAWASPVWVPLLAGQTVTAADYPEQSQQFEMDYGEYINISCFWQGHDRGVAPYVRLAWRANLISPGSLWVRFVNPDSQTIYVELPLGETLEGEARFDQEELGFDPATDKWAVSIVVAKIKA
jgi:hypothetical protein